MTLDAKNIALDMGIEFINVDVGHSLSHQAPKKHWHWVFKMSVLDFEKH